MPPKDKNNPNKIFLIALLLSVLFIHLPLLLFLTRMDWDPEPLAQQTQKKKEKVVMLNLKQPTKQPSLPVAVTEKPKVQKTPKNVSAWSKYNSSVAKEQVGLGLNRKPGAPNQNQQAGSSSQKTVPAKTPQQTTQQTTQTAPSTENLTMEQRLRLLKMSTQNKESQKYNERFATAMPTKTQFKTNLSSGNQGGDYLPNYKVGNRTYLNTLANPHISFFVELKKRFGIAFNPAPVLRRSLAQISGMGQVKTVWGLSVDRTGRVVDMKLIKSSGIQDYDYEAKRTMQSSAPYSKPPENLMGSDQLLHMAWTFVVYL